MKDLETNPTYVVKNYDIETGVFDVYYNDGSLANDEWYGPMPLDLDTMRPESEEPLHFQIESRVYTHIQMQKLAECNMDDSKQVLAQMMGVEQSVDMVELMKHRQNQAIKDETHVDPTLSAAQIVNIFSEDDFDEQFEALSAELAED